MSMAKPEYSFLPDVIGSRESFTVPIMTWLAVMEYLCHK